MDVQFEVMKMGLVLYLVIPLMYIVNQRFDCSFFDPVRNSYKYQNINAFGVMCITILFNLLCLPYSIIYWTWYTIYNLLTVGKISIPQIKRQVRKKMRKRKSKDAKKFVL